MSPINLRRAWLVTKHDENVGDLCCRRVRFAGFMNAGLSVGLVMGEAQYIAMMCIEIKSMR